MASKRLITAVATGCCLLIIAGVSWLYLRSNATQAPGVRPETPAYRTTSLRLDDVIFELDIADTPARKELGLGKRPGLAANEGMVFPYDKPGKLCYWMKDMRFSIDILWLDSTKRVVSIEKSLSPDTYPETFCPDEPTQYVVELPAGASERVGIRAGDILPLEL